MPGCARAGAADARRRADLGRLRATRARCLLARGQPCRRRRLCRDGAESPVPERRRRGDLARARRAPRASVAAVVELPAPAVDLARALDRAEPSRRRPPVGRDRARWAHALGRRRDELAGPPSRRAARRPRPRLASRCSRPGVRGRRRRRRTERRCRRDLEPADAGRDRNYTWSVAVDPDDPDCWYVSASTGPFAAHGRRDPQALIYRRRGDETWRPLGGGLPEPLPRCPTRWLPPTGGSSPASPTGRSGRGDDRGDRWAALQLRGDTLPSLVALAHAGD